MSNNFKCKYSDIKEIYEWYRRFADDKMAQMYNTYLDICPIAYYKPSNCSRSYVIGLVMIDTELYKVLTVSGQVKAVMPANIPEYKMTYAQDRPLVRL